MVSRVAISLLTVSRARDFRSRFGRAGTLYRGVLRGRISFGRRGPSRAAPGSCRWIATKLSKQPETCMPDRREDGARTRHRFGTSSSAPLEDTGRVHVCTRHCATSGTSPGRSRSQVDWRSRCPHSPPPRRSRRVWLDRSRRSGDPSPAGGGRGRHSYVVLLLVAAPSLVEEIRDVLRQRSRRS